MEINNVSLIPAIIYSNTETDKSWILADNKGKAGIYMWTHIDSGSIYIGSGVDLSKRLKNYFTESYLKRCKRIYIYNALLNHGYGAFSFTIVEYIDITNLSKEEARQKILSREQYYLDLIFSVDKPNTYNILKRADSSVGYKHTPESLAKMSFAQSGEKHRMFGKTHSEKSIALMSQAHQGKTHTAESKVKIALSLGKKVYLYDKDNLTILFKEFISHRATAKFLLCDKNTISNYIDTNKIYKDKWVICSTKFEQSSISNKGNINESNE